MHRDTKDTSFSALDEDDFQTLRIENKLGCDIYLKKVEQNSDTIDQLHHDDSASVWIPPPRFSDRLNVADECREARYYVSIQILEAKVSKCGYLIIKYVDPLLYCSILCLSLIFIQGLPIIDDGNGHSFFCALRLVVESQASDQQKLFPQSARTKCVKPLISKSKDLCEGTAKWNELFIFEIPRKVFWNIN